MYRHLAAICDSNILKKNSRNFLCGWFLLGKMCGRKSSWNLFSRLILFWKKLLNLILQFWGKIATINSQKYFTQEFILQKFFQ